MWKKIYVTIYNWVWLVTVCPVFICPRPLFKTSMATLVTYWYKYLFEVFRNMTKLAHEVSLKFEFPAKINKKLSTTQFF